MTPRCPFHANNGRPCRLEPGHGGPHDPMAVGRGRGFDAMLVSDLDDPSDDVMEYRERRDEELRREESL